MSRRHPATPVIPRLDRGIQSALPTAWFPRSSRGMTGEGDSRMLDKAIAITPGEPAGIGPDLICLLANQGILENCVIIADKNLLQERAQQLTLTLPSELQVIHIPLKATVTPGQLDPANADYVLETLNIAVQGCVEKKFQGLVTGPVHKGVINQAGIPFSGHTEYFADLTKTNDVVMMLMTEALKVALVTTHIPLAKVATAITKEKIQKTISIVHHALQHCWDIPNPNILVCGLNPHAGEQGYLGVEEQEIIIPALNELREQNINCQGPYPADTIFIPKYLNQADVIIAQYHDQGLPVLKHLGFGSAVNVTLGLPFMRTSVDHGTALDLAGTGKIDVSSMKAAIYAMKQSKAMYPV